MRSKMDNLEIELTSGDFPNGRKIICVPRCIKGLNKRGYVPYINIDDERGVVGTLARRQDLLKLKKWLDIAINEFGRGKEA